MMVYSVHTKNLFPGGNSISRRHGALNIGGNLCRIGNEAFMGFIGILDEVSYSTPLLLITKNVHVICIILHQ